MEVFGITADRLPAILAALGRVEPVGQSFPVYKVVGFDERRSGRGLAAARVEAGPGPQGFAVEGDPSMTVKEAASRRDFTVNAIAWDPLTGEYVDPFDGRSDLDRRLLRMVDRRRSVMTVSACCARFSSQRASSSRWNPRPPRCAAAFLSMICRPSESGANSKKLLVQSAPPSLGLALGLDLGIIDALLPELRPLVGCPQEPEWHPKATYGSIR
jgi:tRNA nucleotidyltransferase (CCA-adding enzyme)